jgi:hypothetical protein
MVYDQKINPCFLRLKTRFGREMAGDQSPGFHRDPRDSSGRVSGCRRFFVVARTRSGNTPGGQAGFCSSILPEISEPRFHKRDEEVVEASPVHQGDLFSSERDRPRITPAAFRAGVPAVRGNGMVERTCRFMKTHQRVAAGQERYFLTGVPAGVDGPGRRTTERIRFQPYGIALSCY